MAKSTLALILVLSLGWSGHAQTRPTTQPSADTFFGLANVAEFHITVLPDQWQAMQPIEPQRPFGLLTARPASRPANPGLQDRPAAPGPGGPVKMEFPWVPATFEYQSQRLEGVGIRFKGNSSYRASVGNLKRPLKLDFNHFKPGQHFLGLTQLSLSNNTMDPSQAREALAYELFRAAGVPASRTAYVKMFLTVPGQMDHRYIGVYTAVEDVAKPFLKSHFGSAKGMLLKPEGFRGLPYFGDDWDAYLPRIGAKGDVSPEDAQRFIAFARLVNQSDDADFRRQIADFLDVDGFLRFIAINGAGANMDSLFAMGHNYYLYLNPQTHKFVYIPWDLNEAFGAFMMAGGPDVQSDLSIKHPHVGGNRLIERVLAIPEYDQAYRKHLAAIISGPMSLKVIDENLKKIEIACREPIAQESAAGVGDWRRSMRFGPGGANKPDIREIVAKRIDSITAQLAGQSVGRIPEFRRGPGGPGAPGGTRPPRDEAPRP